MKYLILILSSCTKSNVKIVKKKEGELIFNIHKKNGKKYSFDWECDGVIYK